MNFLFVHQNFPGQYLHLVQYLQEAGHTLRFVTQRRDREIPGVPTLEYMPLPVSTGVQPFLAEFEMSMMNGLAVARLCEGLKRDGFNPDLIIGHTGWGELLFVKDVWPDVPFLGYFEFFYHFTGSDLDFDPEFPSSPEDAKRIRMRNSVPLLSMQAADWGHTPTKWQRDQYPADFHHRISVIHEGIDTDRVRPDPGAQLLLSNGISLSRKDPIVTYSARNLEPYRGFHVFMRALPSILERAPNARIVIIGADGVSYGRRPSQGNSWRDYMMAEVGKRLDMSRVHFVGWLTYGQYLAVLQISSAHIYLTYPFVLSWGLLEAMSAGCLVLGSRTPPVEEVIDGTTNGYLVDFFDTEALAERVCWVLKNQDAVAPIREQARRSVIDNFDLKTVCLPAHLALIHRLSGTDPVPRSQRRRRSAARAALASVE
ncbi:MAG TPA: glycosyltransferase family 4 protein [Stellaceae bacterium]|jgi:glycosyltransferase involved in cell wall biosynthesis|nr:glycosyltransferase family 4 protein [Stellaceae bacterium]